MITDKAQGHSLYLALSLLCPLTLFPKIHLKKKKTIQKLCSKPYQATYTLALKYHRCQMLIQTYIVLLAKFHMEQAFPFQPQTFKQYCSYMRYLEFCLHLIVLPYI